MSEWITNQKKQNDPTSVMPRGGSTRGGRVPAAMVVVIIKRGAKRRKYALQNPPPAASRGRRRASEPPSIFSATPSAAPTGAFTRASSAAPSRTRRARARLDAPVGADPRDRVRAPRGLGECRQRPNPGAAGSVLVMTPGEAIKTKVIHDAASPSANTGRRWRGTRADGDAS
ncbi:mitochondrial carrier C19G12.05-like protein 1 [Colletotrichum plurivorum]|uniref:Mitochondrial carrier C19G12.05-like protein 1 n=1 Tax=Colletotrichum plurivorum TaxID=2175906 RepID=A0A8H6K4S7_9PEZI|nr:mitochondrial carrier C19G12.05-like protein 1 [Colletotrichum plurivorum]